MCGSFSYLPSNIKELQGHMPEASEVVSTTGKCVFVLQEVYQIQWYTPMKPIEGFSRSATMLFIQDYLPQSVPTKQCEATLRKNVVSGPAAG